MERKSLQSFDGTRIVYEVGGTGDRWLVAANGYGGSFWAWRELFEHLEDRFRLLTWDYRGFHNSGSPADRSHLRIEDNCRDLDCLMQAEGIDSMALAGWSVGVQVALEQYRRRPQAVSALLLINGAHGRVLHRSGDGRLTGLVMPAIAGPWARAMRAVGPAVLPRLQALARSPLPIKFFYAVGLVSRESPAFREALHAVLGLDWATYLEMGKLADEHDTEDLLPRVQVPTLVTAGDRDIITRPAVARHIASRIPGAEYFEIPGGTHYTVLEFPRLMANRISSFLGKAETD
jgi:pimeloyl-ACP methyl ester carboxylesterase